METISPMGSQNQLRSKGNEPPGSGACVLACNAFYLGDEIRGTPPTVGEAESTNTAPRAWSRLALSLLPEPSPAETPGREIHSGYLRIKHNPYITSIFIIIIMPLLSLLLTYLTFHYWLPSPPADHCLRRKVVCSGVASAFIWAVATSITIGHDFNLTQGRSLWRGLGVRTWQFDCPTIAAAVQRAECFNTPSSSAPQIITTPLLLCMPCIYESISLAHVQSPPFSHPIIAPLSDADLSA